MKKILTLSVTAVVLLMLASCGGTYTYSEMTARYVEPQRAGFITPVVADMEVHPQKIENTVELEVVLKKRQIQAIMSAEMRGVESPIVLSWKKAALAETAKKYNADDIVSGQYLTEMREQMELLFSCEPYKTYRQYFTVSTAIAVSPESGIPTFFGSPVGGKTRFDSEAVLGEFRGDNTLVWNYALQHGSDITQEREGQTTIVVLLNTNTLADKTYVKDNGRSISYLGKSTDQYPYDQRGYVLREVGGTGFGKLAPEHINHFTFIKACVCPFCNELPDLQRGKALGWYENVSLSGKMNDVPWSHLIFDERYAQNVDIYEGAWKHARGIYRSEEQSVMSTYIPYYNTISREAIVKRILEYSGEGYTFEKFVANDKREIPE